MTRKEALNPKPVMPLQRELTQAEPQDSRPFWKRLLTGIRPFGAVERIKKTGKLAGTVGVKTTAEF